ncbi:class I SAM-dependent methyltransferase [Micromonospora sp. LOL_021]|uniref:class I SAM-dependent methyltransferase n=1 Tax=Micromonospora sp. LOL_021 TaxID=3345417 RepID=UPI003A8811C7
MSSHTPVDNFNRIAARYDRHPGQFGCRRADTQVLDAAADAMLDAATDARLAGKDRPPEPTAVLDVGCGTGRLLARAAARWPDATLIGVDPAVEMVRVARQRLPNTVLAVAGAEALPLDDGSVDLVLSTTSLGHWIDQTAGCTEIRRVLAPTGQAVIAEHTPPPGWLKPLLSRFGDLPRHLTEPALRQLLTSAGLRPQRTARIRGGLLLVAASPA